MGEHAAPTRSRLLAVIPARGGSRGLPGKNIRPFAGVPLIAHTIRYAKRCSDIARCIVTTDSPAIAEVARQHGGDVPFLRPAELAQHATPMWPVLRHALAQVEAQDGAYDALLLLDPTSPTRELSDVAEALRRLEAQPDADGIISVSQPDANPIWHCVVDRDGWMADLIAGGNRFACRQELPVVYHINGLIYIWRTAFLRRVEQDFWRDEGRFLMYETPELRAVSIDTPDQFDRAELLVKGGVIRLPWLEPAPAPAATPGAVA